MDHRTTKNRHACAESRGRGQRRERLPRRISTYLRVLSPTIATYEGIRDLLDPELLLLGCRPNFARVVLRRAADLGPRLAGVSAPRAPLSRCRRQSVRVDEYKPSRRRIAPIPPTSAAPSVSAKTRSFVCAVKVRRRGRSSSLQLSFWKPTGWGAEIQVTTAVDARR
jgi:hypothetical protein